MLDFQAKDEASSPPNLHTYIHTHGLNKGFTTHEGAQQWCNHSTSAMAPFLLNLNPDPSLTTKIGNFF
jgi:hypothetical protein